MTSRKTNRCRICGNPLDSDSSYDYERFKYSGLYLFHRNALDFLGENCLCCLSALSSPPVADSWKIRGKKKRDRIEELEKAGFDLVVCRYLIAEICRIYKLRKKKRTIIDVPPPVGNARKKLMLELVYQIYGLMHKSENRDISRCVQRYGTAGLWLGSAIYRHYRKKYKISGDICRPEFNNRPYQALKDAKEDIEHVEERLDRIAKQVDWGYANLVWVRIYIESHLREGMLPLKVRLERYKANLYWHRRRVELEAEEVIDLPPWTRFRPEETGELST